MNKEFFQEIEIPEGVEVNIEGRVLKVKGPEGENQRKFNIHKLKFQKKDNKIIIGDKKITKTEKKMINTITAHIKNMLKGVQEKFVYELKIAYTHFPMTVKAQGNKLTINNFYGEKIPREIRIKDKAEVKVEKEEIKVISVDKEIAGQVAADIETATRITSKDKRIFQDGIYITKKAGEEI